MVSAAADRGRYGNARNSILKAIFAALHKAQLSYTLPRVAEANHDRLGGPKGANRAWENSQLQDTSGTGATAQSLAQQVWSQHLPSPPGTHLLMLLQIQCTVLRSVVAWHASQARWHRL